MSERVFSLDEMLCMSGNADDCLDVLLLADESYPAAVVQEHVDALRDHSRHRVTVRSPRNTKTGWSKLLKKPQVLLQTEEGGNFDAVVIHYSLCILYESYLPLYLREALHKFQGFKIQIIQDEYRSINRMMDEMLYLGIDGLFSSLATDNLEKVYRHPDIRRVVKVSALPGYVSKSWVEQDPPPMKEREKHLIYRGREIPFWLGNVAREKTTLSNEISKRIEGQELVTDLSSREEDRIYGNAWVDFMKSGKAVLGLEGGASIFDFDDSIESKVRAYQEKNPDAGYEEVHQLFLAPHEGNIVHRTITPRSFEAIAVRTAQVMFPGDYRGVLEPWRHYLPLQRDFSNLDEVCGFLQDDD
ncbi:MAG: hypothetical protein VCA36_13340, partial [Opitutales bacterium]